MLFDQLLVAAEDLFQDLLTPVVHEHLQEVGRLGLHAFCQAVQAPALLALGHLPAVEKQPQLLALVQGRDELLEVREDLLELVALTRRLEEGPGVRRDGAQAVPLPATSASSSSRAWEIRRSCSSLSKERPMTCSEAWTTMSATSRRTSRRAASRSRSISSRARWMMRSPSSRASFLVRSRWASACLRASSRIRRPSPRASSIWRLYSARSSRASERVFSASSMDCSIWDWRSWICLRIGGYTYLMSRTSRIRNVTTVQKIRLVLPRSKIPVGSSCASTISTPFPCR